ncbi:hypothetical protein [Ekhidna sp.]|uniref:hypothetical protein n=1 Tax=Ekhidna sp. TaxID=2608089 RepID=UPI0032F06E5A
MKRAKLFYSVIIIICLIVISWSTYYTLGGFEPMEVFVMEGKERTIIGKEYREKFDYDLLKARYHETKAAIDSGKLQGQVAIVYFNLDESESDTVHYFVGAYKDEIKDVLRLPAGYSYKEFKTDKIFKVFLTQHWLVRPNREEIAEMMEVKAIEEGVVLQPYSFDLYYEDGSQSTERWAR